MTSTSAAAARWTRTPTSAAPPCEIAGVTKEFGALRRGRRPDAHRAVGLVLRAARAVRLRQDDDAADGRRPRAAHERHDLDRRARRDRDPGAPAARQHGLPELRAVPAPDGRGERRVRAAPDAARRTIARRVSGGRSSSSSWPTSPTAGPRSSPAGSSSASRSPRALVNRPSVLLLDEPLGALDLKLRRQMQLELKRIQTEVGLTFIHVTHDQEEAMTMADTVAVMNRRAHRADGLARRADQLPADRVRRRTSSASPTSSPGLRESSRTTGMLLGRRRRVADPRPGAPLGAHRRRRARRRASREAAAPRRRPGAGGGGERARPRDRPDVSFMGSARSTRSTSRAWARSGVRPEPARRLDRARPVPWCTSRGPPTSRSRSTARTLPTRAPWTWTTSREHHRGRSVRAPRPRPRAAPRARRGRAPHLVLLGPGLLYLALFFVVPGRRAAGHVAVRAGAGRRHRAVRSRVPLAELHRGAVPLLAGHAALVLVRAPGDGRRAGHRLPDGVRDRDPRRERKLLQGMLLVLVIAPFFTSFILRTRRLEADPVRRLAGGRRPALAQPAPRGRAADRDPVRGRPAA